MKKKRRRWDSSAAEGDVDGAAPTAPKSTSAAKAGLDPSSVAAALQKAKEAAKLQRGIDSKLKGLAGGLPSVDALKAATQARLAEAALAMQHAKQAAENKMWKPLLLDKHGRQIDEAGKVVVMQRNTATLKVNQRSEDPKAGGGKVKTSRARPKEVPTTHVDPRVEMPATGRERRVLRFVKPGKYIARAQTMRMKQISREMRSNQFETTEEGSVRRQMALEPIPVVEWWDEALLEGDSYAEPLLAKEGAVTSMVHVPVLLDPVAESVEPPPMQMMLTAKERKKIKRIKKTEKQKEEQDKIRLGLMQAPEPKMRLSNLMRVLGNEAIMEPSAMEAKVRTQMAERQKAHEEHNAARMLTPEQKREKKRKKLTEDTNIEVHIAVFRAGDLTDGKRRYKVDIHAQQFNLTGAAVIYGNTNVVCVEGGPKGIKKFTQLMMNRIKWMPEEGFEEEEEVEEETEEGAAPVKKVYKKCIPVWQGVSHKRSFRTFRFEQSRSEQAARKIFKDKNVPQYWDMCRNYNEETQ